MHKQIDYSGLKFENSKIILSEIDQSSYLAAMIADFIRHQLTEQGVNFSFETVMSDESKVRFLQETKSKGYRNYLYFVCTDDPATNVGRVRERTENNGHDVSIDKIVDRYPRSLALLYDAVMLSSRAFLFDNSGEKRKFICEIENAKTITLAKDLKAGDLPDWFITHFVMKLPKALLDSLKFPQ